MIDLSLAPRNRLLQNLSMKRGRSIYKGDDDRYYLSDNVTGRKLRPIQTGRGYNFTGVEWVAKYGNFTIERNQTISYKGWISYNKNTSSSTSGILISNINSGAPYQGFELTLYQGTHPTKAKSIRAWLANSNTAGNLIEVAWFDNDIPIDEFCYIEFDYDGSSTAAGCSLKVNGNLQIPTVLTDNLSATIAGNTGVSVSSRDGSSQSNGATPFKLGPWELSVDGVNKLKVNCDETAGLISYDSSGNGDNATINLGGSAESGFHITSNEIPSMQNELGYNVAGTDVTNPNALIPVNQATPTEDVLGNTLPDAYVGHVRYDTLVKYNNVFKQDKGALGSVSYITFGSAGDFNNSYFQFELSFIYDDDNWNYTRRLAGYDDSDNYGWLFQVANNDLLRFRYNNAAYNLITLEHDKLYTIRFRVKSGAVVVYINDVLEFNSNIGVINYNNESPLLIGAIYFGNTILNEGGAIRYLWADYKVLDASGATTATTLTTYFSEGAGLTVYNIAAAAPANTNGSIELSGNADGTQWGISNRQYPKNLIEGYNKVGDVYIPADPSNPTNDILGNPLQFIGNGKTVINSENSYNRNYADSPELVASGIPKTEDISYEDITGDISRFYGTDGNQITDLLNYSDFVEPMDSGAYNFTGAEGIFNIPTGSIERTDSFYYKGIVKNGGNTSFTALFACITNSAPFRGFNAVMYNSLNTPLRNNLKIQLISDNAAGNKIDVDYDVLTGDIQEIEIWYDGSSLASGLTVKVDGVEVAQTAVNYDNLTATIASETAMSIAKRSTNLYLDGRMTYYYGEFWINGSIAWVMNSNEGNGLVAYDSSGQNNHGIISLGGSSESSFHLDNVDKQNLPTLQYGATRAGYFDLSRYGTMESLADYRVTNFEVNTTFMITQNTTQNMVFNINPTRVTNNNSMGFELYANLTAVSNKASVQWGTGTTYVRRDGIVLELNRFYHVKFTLIDGTGRLYIDGVQQSVELINSAISWTTDTTTTRVGCRGRNSLGDNVMGGAISSITYHELNSSGVRIKELINLDWNNGDEISVPNIAANAPDGSDMTWTVSDGDYSYIPGDPTNLGFDVLGNPINNQDEVDKYQKITNYLKK